MSYSQKYYQELSEIINHIKQGDIEDSVAKFRAYISTLDVGKYNTQQWFGDWRRAVYEFGELFTDRDAGLFIRVIEEYLEKPENIAKKEAVEFIYSEILWNYFEQGSSYVSKLLKGLIEQYPINPEFHNTYSHFLEKNGNYDLALDESFLAWKIDASDFFKMIYFNKCKAYFNRLLSQEKIEKASLLLPQMRKVIKKGSDAELNNIIVSLTDRLVDHRTISERLSKIGGIAKKAVEKEHSKIIEIMGFFVAILGFVFININLAISSLGFREILLVMTGMGIILAFFATIISLLFNPQKNVKFQDITNDRRFYIIAGLIFLFVIFMLKYY